MKTSIKELRTDIQQRFFDYWEDEKENLDINDPVEIHPRVFNEDYFIIGRFRAEQWLGNCVFEVINTIKDYEQDNFGEVTTDFSEPERVANMYAYIIGEEVIFNFTQQ